MITIDDLGINLNKKAIITLVGAGGKTSIMFDLADKLSEFNKKVLITTTTKIYLPEKNSVELHIGKIKENTFFKEKKVVAGREVIKNNKIKGYSKKEIEKIFTRDIFDYILVEGDGGRKKPIKAPRKNEPVVPEKTNILIGIIGMDAYGSKISESNVFGLKEFIAITNKKENELIDKEDMLNLIKNKKGLFKEKGIRNILLLNKVNNSNKHIADEIKAYVEEYLYKQIDAVVIVEEIK